MKKIPAVVRKLAQRYKESGHELYVVGGAVRDYLLGKPISDFDFATSATPEETFAMFRRVIPTGIKHGTVTILLEDERFEVTTYRLDGVYGDQRRPDSVTYTASLEEDLKRRDLTINAIALDPITREIIDPFDGKGDLKRRVIRAVGDPHQRFGEDALRLVRAIRFATLLRFNIQDETLQAIRDHASDVGVVAPERIRQELEKMMTAATPSSGWYLLRDTGLLKAFLPELLEEEEISSLPNPILRDAPPHDLPDVFGHLVDSCDCAPPDIPVLRWSALFHDIGKPRCFQIDDRGVHFHEHDRVSAEMSEKILRRLRFPNDHIAEITHLIRNHMFGYTADWSDSAVRRFVSRIGKDHVFMLTALRRIDTCGKRGTPDRSSELTELEARIRSILSTEPPLTIKDLKIDGKDLMEFLQIPQGPTVGRILDELLQSAIDDPSLNNRDRLLAIAHNFYETRLN